MWFIDDKLRAGEKTKGTNRGDYIAVLKKCSLVLNPQLLVFVRSGAGSSVGRTTQSVRSDRLILIFSKIL